MRDYIVRRLLLVIPVMIGVSFATFLAFRVIAGDAAVITCGLGCTPQVASDLRHEFHLDKPLLQQYGDWLGVTSAHGILEGDLGTSFHTKLPVTTELGRRLPVTGELMFLSIILSLILGIPAGVLSAVRPGTIIDWITRLVSVLWLSVPSFYLGILIITFGSSWFGWSPPQFGASGTVSFFRDPLLNLEIYLPPALVLAVGIAAVIMRLTRSSMLEVMRNDYIRTAWAKGLRERGVVWRHALKNAMIPVATITGLQIGALIGGSVIIESVFGLNGMGVYLLESVLKRDLFVVPTVVLLFAIVYVVANLCVDLTYAWLDPRIRYS